MGYVLFNKLKVPSDLKKVGNYLKQVEDSIPTTFRESKHFATIEGQQLPKIKQIFLHKPSPRVITQSSQNGDVLS
jgi:hypothetical protein